MLPASVHVSAFASVLVVLWPFAGIAVSVTSTLQASSEYILPHVPQVQYAMLPASVHVSAFASVLVVLWPGAAITVSAIVISIVQASSEKILSHVPQVQYAMLPTSVHVAAVASVFVVACAPTSPSVTPQTKQALGAWQVASSQMCVHAVVSVNSSFSPSTVIVSLPSSPIVAVIGSTPSNVMVMVLPSQVYVPSCEWPPNAIVTLPFEKDQDMVMSSCVMVK